MTTTTDTTTPAAAAADEFAPVALPAPALADGRVRILEGVSTDDPTPEEEALRAALDLGVPRPAGLLPCQWCGAACESTEADVTETMGAPFSIRLWTVTFGTCPACSTLVARAESLRATFDLPEGAALSVVLAFDLLGLDAPKADELSPGKARSLARQLAGVGLVAAFRNLILHPSRDLVAPERWGCVPGFVVEDARRGLAAALARTVALGAPPVTVPAPAPLGGCAVCGVESVTVPAVEFFDAGRLASAFWPQTVMGAMCRSCRTVSRDLGDASGLRVGEVALARWVGWGGQWLREDSLNRSAVFAMAKPHRGVTPTPGAEPWAWLGTRAELEDAIRRYLVNGRG